MSESKKQDLTPQRLMNQAPTKELIICV